jgi:thiamine biosynthesis lipoprotein
MYHSMILEVNPIQSKNQNPFGRISQRDFWFIPVALLLLLFQSCETQKSKVSPDDFVVKLNGEAQGSTWQIVYYDLEKRNFSQGIDSVLKAVDESISTYLPGSNIDRWNKSDSGVWIDSMFFDVVSLSWRVYRATNGAFDPTVKPLVSYWGFGPELFAHPDNVDKKAIDSLLALVNFDSLYYVMRGYKRSLDAFHDPRLKLTFPIFLAKPDPRMQLDFNAVGQGWSVDVVSEYLKSKGIEKYFVEIGGEIRVGYPKPDGSLWRFGIDKPIEDLEQRELEAVINLRNRGLATSGNYRKFYEKDGVKYSHTIDPKTGYPVTHSLLSATVVAGDAGLSDAMATAFMVMGTDSAIHYLENINYTDCSAFLIYTDSGKYKTWVSKDVENKITAVE